MADVKISALPAATIPLAGTELVPVVQGGVTKQVAASQLASGGSGTVTSVGMTVPVGLSVSGSPVTTSGTLAVSYAAGYAIPTTAKQTEWDTAYSWGNHASAGYVNAAGAAAAAPVQSVAGKTGTVTLAKGDVGLSNVDNTSDVNKPVSTAQQTAIDAKVSKTGDTMTGPLSVPAGASGAQVPQAQETYGPKNGQLAGMRNKIINGAFGINQRGYVSGAATTAGQYTLDRWKVTGTGGITFSTTANKTTVTIPSGQTLQQVIEGLNLQTGTYVLSWEGTAQGRISGGSYGASGAVTASITGGTNTTIEFNAGTVANVQLEPGTIATPFEHRTYGTELALCQRYYQSLTGIPAAGLITGGANALFAVNLTTMRVLPTVSFDRYADWSIHTGAANITFTGHLITGAGTTQSFELQLTGLSGGTVSQAAQLRNYDVGAGTFRQSARIRCDSEL